MHQPPDPPPPGQERVFTVAHTLRQIQGTFFYDYAAFTGTLREYVAAALETQFKRAPNPRHRRAFVLSVYREEYTAYEDLGAFMDALLSHAADPAVLPMECLLRYGPGEVRLDKVLANRGITTGDHLCDSLHFGEWIPSGWSNVFPDIDLPKVLRRACFYIVECARSQKNEGVSAFNKVKHAGIVAPDARRYVSSLPDAPAAIYLTAPRDKQPQATPVAVLAITTGTAEVEERLRQIHFIQRTLRLIVLLFVVRHHAEVIEGLGVDPSLAVFHLPEIADLCEFAKNLASTPWEPPAEPDRENETFV